MSSNHWARHPPTSLIPGLRVIWGQCCPGVAAGPCLPNGPITQLRPYLTRKPRTSRKRLHWLRRGKYEHPQNWIWKWYPLAFHKPNTQAPACMIRIRYRQELIIQMGNWRLNLHASKAHIPKYLTADWVSCSCSFYTFSMWYQSVKCDLWQCLNKSK